MEQNDDGRDQIDEVPDEPTLDYVLDVAEKAGSFESFLSSMSGKGGKWRTAQQQTESNSVDDAAQASGSSTDRRDATDSSASSNAPSVTALSALEIAQRAAGAQAIANAVKNRNVEKVLSSPGYVDNGHTKLEPAVPHPPVVVENLELPTPVAPPVGYVVEKLELHQHPIIGAVVQTSSEYLKNDQELLSVHLNMLRMGIDEMGPVGSVEAASKIIEIINANMRQVVIKNLESYSLQSALEFHLSKMNMRDRATVLEKQMSQKPSAPKRERKVSSGSQTTTVKGSFRHSNPARAKALKSLKDSLRMTKEEIIEQQGSELTQEDERFLNELFG
jgi:hypothetical protein